MIQVISRFERIDHHAVAESLESRLWERLRQEVSDLPIRVDIDELCGLVRHEFFDFMVFDVDVLHATVKDWIFGALQASQVVLVEHGWDFVVIKLLGHLRSFEVFWYEQAVDASDGDVSKLA